MTYSTLWVTISIPPVSLFLMKQTLLYLFRESRKKAKWPHGFQTLSPVHFFRCLYVLLCLKKQTNEAM